MKRILITGACGSIGKELVIELINAGNVVCAFDNDEDGLFHLNKEINHLNSNRLKIFIGDIRDKSRVIKAMENVDEVYHCAALKHVELSEYNPFEALKTNVNGTINVIDAAISNKVKKVLVTSSDKAVNPSSTMGATKLLAEKLTISANNHVGLVDTKFSCVRFGNVWNTNGSVGPIFKKQVLDGKNLTVTDRNMTRFFISKDEAIKLCIDACDRMVGGEIFISDMGATSIGLIADEFLKYNKETKIIQTEPKAGEKLYEELFTDVESMRTYKNSELYIIIPDSIDKETEKFKLIEKTYCDGPPISIALRSDSIIAKKIDATLLVNGLMNVD